MASQIDPRAVAVQGLGFTPRLVAVQGLWPLEEDAPVVSTGYSPQRRRKRQDDDEDVLLLML